MHWDCKTRTCIRRAATDRSPPQMASSRREPARQVAERMRAQMKIPVIGENPLRKPLCTKWKPPKCTAKNPNMNKALMEIATRRAATDIGRYWKPRGFALLEKAPLRDSAITGCQDEGVSHDQTGNPKAPHQVRSRPALAGRQRDRHPSLKVVRQSEGKRTFAL